MKTTITFRSLPFLFLLFHLLFVVPCRAQKDVKYKWNKVSEEELQMSTYAGDPDAPAVVLADVGYIQVNLDSRGFTYTFSRYLRLKILTEAGLEYGDMQVDYYHGDNAERVGSIKAQASQPDGRSFKLKRGDMFEEDLNEYWSRIKLSLPGLQVGSVVELQYNIVSDRITSPREWRFQREIPVQYSEINISHHKWLDYVYLMQSGEYVKKTGEDAQAAVVQGARGDQTFSQFYAENLPGLREEKYITTMDDYYAKLQLQLQAVMVPGEEIQRVFTSWEELAKDLLSSDAFGRQFDRKGQHKKLYEDSQALVSAEGSEKEKVKAIYDFVNSRMEWNESYGFTCSEKMDRLYESGKASSGELNLMLLALLREYDVTAYPVLLSTREHGAPIPTYPIISQFNHVLVYVEIEGVPTLLDAGNPYRPIGLLRTNSLNKLGWVVIEENPQWLEVNGQLSREVFLQTMELSSEGSLSGDFSYSADSYQGAFARYVCEKESQNEFLTGLLEDISEQMTIDSIEVSDLEAVEKSLRISSKVELEGMATLSGDFIYLNIPLATTFGENPFKQKKREYPVEMVAPFQERHILNIKLPEGYTLEAPPEPVNNILPQGSGHFQFQVSQQHDFLQVICLIEIGKTHFPPQEYGALLKFFNLITEKLGEQLVLKKV